MRHDDKLAMRGIPVAYRPPFALGSCSAMLRPPGESILEIVRAMPGLPPAFFDRGIVCINGEPLDRDPEKARAKWPLVRPKPYSDEVPIAVTLHWPLGTPGGGNGTAKAVGSLVAAFALVVLTAGAAGGLFAGLAPGFFEAGSISAKILAGTIGLVGALTISAMSAPPAQQAAASGSVANNNTATAEAASASGNVLSRGGSVPRVIGTRKIFPPLGAEPVVELIGDDEFVECILPLNGPHALNDPRIDNVALADAQDVQFETREGWITDPPLTLVTRQGRTLTPQVELSTHKVNSVTQNLLLDPGAPEIDLPVWHSGATRNAQDEIWLHFLLPSGISVNGTTSTDVGIPLRIRIRLRGTVAWTNLPEIHLSGSTLQQLRRAVLFKWKTAEPIQSVPASGGFVYANVAPNAQVASLTNLASPVAWVADSYFTAAAGANNYLSSGNEASTKVANLNLFSNRVEVYLDPAVFTRGIYEIQVMRGAAYSRASFSNTAYTYSGVVVDFFYYQNIASPQIPMSRANLADRIVFNRIVSIWNDYPVKRPGFALIAIKARNRNVQNISVQASGYVKDWDGSGWNTWTTTSNPAPHYADILSGAQNLDPLPADLRDDTGLVAWRTLCNTHDWTCDAIIDDQRTQDALQLLASCGYARPYQSDIYGVTVDNDRSADAPVQIFSRRNSTNMRFERAYPRVPFGFLVTYRDDASDDDQAQVEVNQRDTTFADNTALEGVTYDGLITTAKVIARAQFDLDQGNLRGTFYRLDTDIQNIVCRRGSLVGYMCDFLSKRYGDGLIVSKTISGGNITGLVLDSEIPITNVADMHAITDMHAVADMHDVGITTGIVIRHTDGTLSSHTLSNATGSTNTLTFATPIADDATIQGFADTNHQYGCLVIAGALGAIYRRMLVQSVQPTNDLKATLTLVDEAPALVRY